MRLQQARNLMRATATIQKFLSKIENGSSKVVHVVDGNGNANTTQIYNLQEVEYAANYLKRFIEKLIISDLRKEEKRNAD